MKEVILFPGAIPQLHGNALGMVDHKEVYFIDRPTELFYIGIFICCVNIQILRHSRAICYVKSTLKGNSCEEKHYSEHHMPSEQCISRE